MNKAKFNYEEFEKMDLENRVDYVNNYLLELMVSLTSFIAPFEKVSEGTIFRYKQDINHEYNQENIRDICKVNNKYLVQNYLIMWLKHLTRFNKFSEQQ